MNVKGLFSDPEVYAAVTEMVPPLSKPNENISSNWELAAVSVPVPWRAFEEPTNSASTMTTHQCRQKGCCRMERDRGQRMLTSDRESRNGVKIHLL